MPSQASTSSARCPACRQRLCICIPVGDEQQLAATHTPGPWQATVSDCTSIYGLNQHHAVVAPGIRMVADICPGEKSEDEANASLIAAAPELLMAVKDAIDFIGSIATDNESDHGELAMIRLLEKSVAKAEGQ